MGLRAFLEALSRLGPTDMRWRYDCGDGEVTLAFITMAGACLPPGASPDDLPRATASVQILVTPRGTGEGQFSARFSGRECAELLGGRWPCPETFGRIARQVRDRNRYGTPVADPPSPRSAAQGQTKKDGSHSHDRHR